MLKWHQFFSLSNSREGRSNGIFFRLKIRYVHFALVTQSAECSSYYSQSTWNATFLSMEKKEKKNFFKVKAGAFKTETNKLTFDFFLYGTISGTSFIINLKHKLQFSGRIFGKWFYFFCFFVFGALERFILFNLSRWLRWICWAGINVEAILTFLPLIKRLKQS